MEFSDYNPKNWSNFRISVYSPPVLGGVHEVGGGKIAINFHYVVIRFSILIKKG